jgi:hypothetical protein
LTIIVHDLLVGWVSTLHFTAYHTDSTRSLGNTFPRTELRMALINSKKYGRHPRKLFDSPHPKTQLALGALLDESSRLKEKLENMKYRVAELRKELERRVCRF